MKQSNYNIFYPYLGDENKYIAYNSFSNALALLDKEKYEKYIDFCNNKNDLDEEFVEDLKKGLFLIEDNIDELELIRQGMLISRYNSDSFGVTIAPTLDCNFRCVYCYEKDSIKQCYMNEETQNNIVELLKSKVKTIRHFSVTWYGGEPLMALNVIENLSKQFIEICKENDVVYSAGMISNGYLLTRPRIEKLNEANVSYYQVTIDGKPEDHNFRRPLVGGKPTFDKIMQNLKDNIDILPPVALRMNIDKNNLESGAFISNYLREKGLEGKVSPYLANTTNSNDAYDSPSCMSTEEFSDVDFENDMALGERMDIRSKYPRRIQNFCGADSLSSLVIAADGELYKCWCDIGVKDRCIGNINENQGYFNTAYLDYMSYDVTKDEKCKDCKLLPICMGGCPFQRLEKADVCSMYKHKLENYLNAISETIKKQQEIPNAQEEAI